MKLQEYYRELFRREEEILEETETFNEIIRTLPQNNNILQAVAHLLNEPFSVALSQTENVFLDQLSRNCREIECRYLKKLFLAAVRTNNARALFNALLFITTESPPKYFGLQNAFQKELKKIIALYNRQSEDEKKNYVPDEALTVSRARGFAEAVQVELNRERVSFTQAIASAQLSSIQSDIVYTVLMAIVVEKNRKIQELREKCEQLERLEKRVSEAFLLSREMQNISVPFEAQWKELMPSCAYSHKMMMDPVQAEDGYYYNRAEILEYILQRGRNGSAPSPIKGRDCFITRDGLKPIPPMARIYTLWSDRAREIAEAYPVPLSTEREVYFWHQLSLAIMCPISLLPMNDPVLLQDGYCYERGSLETLFTRARRENRRFMSPITREAMQELVLHPVDDMKRMGLVYQKFLSHMQHEEKMEQLANELTSTLRLTGNRANHADEPLCHIEPHVMRQIYETARQRQLTLMRLQAARVAAEREADNLLTEPVQGRVAAQLEQFGLAAGAVTEFNLETIVNEVNELLGPEAQDESPLITN